MEIKGREQWYSKLFRVFNSTVCFCLAYITITWGGFFAMGFAAKLIHFDPRVYYFGTSFGLNGEKWSGAKIVWVYSAAPLFSLLFGLLAIFLSFRLRQMKSNINLYFIWCFVIGTSVFTSQSIIASLGVNEIDSDFYQNLAVVFTWWGLPSWMVYAFNIFFIIFIFYFSVNYGKPFLRLAYSSKKVVKSEKRRKYFFETALVPFFIGTGVIVGLLSTFKIHFSPVTFSRYISLHTSYQVVTGVSLLIAWFALFYIGIDKEDVLKYKSLQSFGFAFACVLLIVLYFINVSWQGINL